MGRRFQHSVLLAAFNVAASVVRLVGQPQAEQKSVAFEVASIKPIGPFSPIPALGPRL